MLTVLFWNVGGLEREQVCARLAHRHGATILFLAECPRPLSVLRALNPSGSAARYSSHPKTACRVTTFSTLDRADLTLVEDSRHYAIRRLASPGCPNS